jgi:hypothetical protein
MEALNDNTLLGEVLGKHGTNQYTGGGSVTTSSIGRGANYTLARLRRDHPELAERVIAGEISANAAAIISNSPGRSACRLHP